MQWLSKEDFEALTVNPRAVVISPTRVNLDGVAYEMIEEPAEEKSKKKAKRE